jgi:nucleoside-diphosphate-sugar epimerase
MKIGIIGSSGFLGKNLYQYLGKKKKYKLICFPSFKKYKKKWIKVVLKKIHNTKPEIIINCAASQIFIDNEKSIKELINSNILSQSLFLNEAVKNNNLIGYISFGSKWEYDQVGNYNPLNFYASTKNAVDQIFKFFTNRYKITIVSLKLFDTYGKNDKRKKIINLLLESYKKKKILNISPGEQTLDYVNIIDICNLLSIICLDIKNKKIRGFNKYSISSKKPIKLKNLIKILNKNLNNKLKINIAGKKYRKNEAMISSAKYFNYPRWKPRIDLIKELKKYFLER